MKNDHAKQVYYGTNERTILICEVSVNGKLKRNKGVNDRRGPQGTGIWDPCLKTWDDACQRAGISAARCVSVRPLMPQLRAAAAL